MTYSNSTSLLDITWVLQSQKVYRVKHVGALGCKRSDVRCIKAVQEQKPVTVLLSHKGSIINNELIVYTVQVVRLTHSSLASTPIVRKNSRYSSCTVHLSLALLDAGT